MKTKLGSLGDIFIGLTYKPEDVSEQGMVVLRSGNIQDGKLVFDDIVRVSKNVSDRFFVKENDILMCSRNGSARLVGKSALIPHLDEKMSFGAFMTIIRTPYNSYLKHFFDSEAFRRQLGSSATSTINQITKNMLDNIEVDLPEKNDMDSIVCILDKINQIISKQKTQLSKFDELIKSRFIELFGDCENEVLIGEVISISRGASPRPISAFITDSDDGVNWIKIGDVSENSLYITKTEEKITPEGAKKSRMVHKGDFILSNSMSFGRPYILGINGCVHDGWLIMSNFKDTFNELYLYHAIRSDDVQYQFSGKVNGATVKNLNSDLVKNTFIKVPSMELQEHFAAFVEQTDKSKYQCEFTSKLEVAA